MKSTSSITPPGEDASSVESLGDSFRQARLEMWVMVGAWVFFFLWVTLVCANTAFANPDGTDGGEVPTLFGIPRWVALGIAIPWLAANGFIVWFALRFMKDTLLPVVDSETGEIDSTKP